MSGCWHVSTRLRCCKLWLCTRVSRLGKAQGSINYELREVLKVIRSQSSSVWLHEISYMLYAITHRIEYDLPKIDQFGPREVLKAIRKTERQSSHV